MTSVGRAEDFLEEATAPGQSPSSLSSGSESESPGFTHQTSPHHRPVTIDGAYDSRKSYRVRHNVKTPEESSIAVGTTVPQLNSLCQGSGRYGSKGDYRFNPNPTAFPAVSHTITYSSVRSGSDKNESFPYEVEITVNPYLLLPLKSDGDFGGPVTSHITSPIKLGPDFAASLWKCLDVYFGNFELGKANL